MFRFLYSLSEKRAAWLLLILSTLIPEAAALWFQHIRGLEPCVICIYERCALFAIAGAGIVALIAPRTPLRWMALIIWIYSSWKGLSLAWHHTMLLMHPSLFDNCEFIASFPDV